MKYNYYVDGFKTTHTTFVYYLCRSLAYEHNNIMPSKEDRKYANRKIIYCRKQLSYMNDHFKMASWISPYPCENGHLTFTIVKAE